MTGVPAVLGHCCSALLARVGTPALGTAVLGTLELGTAVWGTPVLGMLALGTVVLGTLALGTAVLGTRALGTPVLGTPARGAWGHRHTVTGDTSTGEAGTRGLGTPVPGTWLPAAPVPRMPVPGTGAPAHVDRRHRYRADGTRAHGDRAHGGGHGGAGDTGDTHSTPPEPRPYRRSPGLAAGAHRRHVGSGGSTRPWAGPEGAWPPSGPAPRPCRRRARSRAAAPLPARPGGDGVGVPAGRGPPSWTSRSSAAPPGPARRRPASRLPGRRGRSPVTAAAGRGASAGERRPLRARGGRPAVLPARAGLAPGGWGVKLRPAPRRRLGLSPRQAAGGPGVTNPRLSPRFLPPPRLGSHTPSFCDESLFGAKPRGPAWAAPWMRKEDVAKLHALLWSPPPAPRTQPGLSPRPRETPLRALRPPAPVSPASAAFEGGRKGQPCPWQRPECGSCPEGRGAPSRGRSQSLSRLNTPSGGLRLASETTRTERCEHQNPPTAPVTPRGPLMRGRSKSVSGPPLSRSSTAVGGCKPRPPWK